MKETRSCRCEPSKLTDVVSSLFKEGATVIELRWFETQNVFDLVAERGNDECWPKRAWDCVSQATPEEVKRIEDSLAEKAGLV